MPFHAQVDKEVQKILNLIGCVVYPVCLSLCMPIFLHHLVMEKEMKLIDNMKTNGLNMFNYYLVNGLYDYVSYAATAGLYWAVGRFMLNLDFFSLTNSWLLLEIYFAWGLC